MSHEALSALIQQLETDRQLGLKSIPIARDVLDRIASTTRPSRQPDGLRTTETHDRSRRVHARESGTTEGKIERLQRLDETQVRGCRKCVLCEQRTRTVFGQGNPDARLMFVGEGPGYDEDKQGLAFVGKAGQLLTRMIAAMGLTREEVYICNVVKCRPPGNRTPSAEEILACLPYLREQIAIVEPEVLVALGAPAAKTLLNTAEAISKLRGRFFDYYLSGAPGVGPSIPVMPTFHPAYLLRSPEEKRKAWDDLQAVMRHLGLAIPEKGAVNTTTN